MHTRLWSLMLGVLLFAGCRATSDLSRRTAKALTPSKSQKNAPDPVEIQGMVFRFSDEFCMAIVTSTDLLRQGANEAGNLQLQKWRLACVSDSWAIASGPNAYVNLLDMAVMVTVVRRAVEEHWVPKVYRDAGKPLLESCRIAETNVWRLADSVLKPGQKSELQQAIEAWCTEHPNLERAFFVRTVGWTSELSRAVKNSKSEQTTSVFNLLMLDPLAGLDPAARELAQTRLFAERAMFIGQRMPNLLRWQMELFTAQTVRIPEVQQLLTNSTDLTSSVDRLSRAAEKLPEQVANERHELPALDQQSGKLRDLAAQVNQTLSAGDKMSVSLNTTFTTFDALMKRFGVGEPETNSGTVGTNGAPFNILDYAHTAEQLAVASKEMDVVLKDFTLAMDSPGWARRVQDADKLSAQAAVHAKGILNHAFMLAAILILLTFVLLGASRILASRSRPAVPNPEQPIARI